MSLLKRIKALREQNGNISINKLEKEAGLTRGSMSKWDNHAPSYEKLKKVADYFGVPVSDLTGEKEKSPAPESEELSDVQRTAVQFVLGLSEENLKKFIKMGEAAFGEENGL